MACDPSGALALLQRFVGPLQPPPGFEGSDAQALLRLARLVALVPMLDSRWVVQTAQTVLHLVALPGETCPTLGKLLGRDCTAEGTCARLTFSLCLDACAGTHSFQAKPC